MSDHAVRSQSDGPPTISGFRDTIRQATGYWWVGLLAGIAWLVVSLVILQFNDASITTVGVLVGVMFLFAGLENVVVATLSVEHRWVPVLFSILFLVAAIICFVN